MTLDHGTLRAHLALLGQTWPKDEIERLIPALERSLPLIAALAELPITYETPVAQVGMRLDEARRRVDR